MKSVNNNVMADVIVSGAKESGNFTIAANGKAFKILINGLYSNKIQAIVRELSSNAFDAQVEAGRGDKPFIMQLPNLLDPTFMIRDYGTSLSHVKVMGLYTTVFESTKEGTNDAVGKFGLGSKTPFAYTDSFTVTAYLRGTKRVYGAYLDVTGIPSISLMASEDTDEEDGLAVSFPVNAVDCERFRVEAERVIRGFDVKPEVRGNVINTSPEALIFDGGYYKIYKGSGKLLARQGCVIYPIDMANIPSPWTPETNRIKNTNILIDFPIGDLDITPSRETLSYDETTIKNIVDMFKKVDEDLISSYKKMFETEIKTMYQAMCFYARYKNANIPSIKNYIGTLVFNGKSVNNYCYTYRDRLMKNYNVAINYFDNYSVTQTSKTLKFNTSRYESSWSVDENTLFVIEKVNQNKPLTNINARIRNNLGDKTNVVWIKDHGASVKQIRSLKKLLGYPPKIIDLSTLTIPAKIPNANNTPVTRIKKNECRIERMNNSGNLYEETVDLNILDRNVTKYIVAHDGYFLIDGYKKGRTISFVDGLFDNFDDIIFVRHRNLDKIVRHGFSNALTDLTKELYKSIDFEKIVREEEMAKLENHWLIHFASDFSKISYEKETSFKKLLDFLKNYVNKSLVDGKNSVNFRKWKQLVLQSEVSQEIDKVKLTNNYQYSSLRDLVKEFINDYPLSGYIIEEHYNFAGEKAVEDLEKYVKMMDMIDNG